MERALGAITLDIDKSETSIIYNALAEAMVEVTQLYIAAEQFYKLAFSIDSEDEWLEKHAAETDTFRDPAISAIRRATFNIPVENGERFFVDDVYYVVIGKDKVEAEEPGVIGNRPRSNSDMLALNNIPGLETAILGDIIIAGAEEESDASLLARHLVKRRREAGSGNKAHYKQWAERVDGVGKAIVVPLWAGRGTVKVIIADSQMQPASPELIQAVKEQIDPNGEDGEGDAPIGATLTVESAAHKDVAVSAHVTLKGNTAEEVTLQIADEIRKLLKSIAFTKSTVKVAAISNILFENEWIDDYSNVLINDIPANLPILENEIPRLSGVILHV